MDQGRLQRRQEPLPPPPACQVGKKSCNREHSGQASQSEFPQKYRPSPQPSPPSWTDVGAPVPVHLQLWGSPPLLRPPPPAPRAPSGAGFVPGAPQAGQELGRRTDFYPHSGLIPRPARGLHLTGPPTKRPCGSSIHLITPCPLSEPREGLAGTQYTVPALPPLPAPQPPRGSPAAIAGRPHPPRAPPTSLRARPPPGSARAPRTASRCLGRIRSFGLHAALARHPTAATSD